MLPLIISSLYLSMTEIKAGAILNYTSMFIRLGVGFLLSPFILECLGKSEFGVYSIAGSIISWLALCDFGLSASTTKFVCEYQARGDREGEAHYLGNIAALFAVIGSVVLVSGLCIYPFLNQIFPKFTAEEMQLCRILYLMSLFNTAIMFPARSLGGITTARQKYKVPGVVGLLFSVLTIASTVAVLLLGYKSIVLCAASITWGVIGLLWNVYYSFVTLKARMTWNGWDFPLCKSMFAFSFWMFLDQLIGIFNWGCGNAIIGMTQGASQVAVYSYGLALMHYYFTASNCISGLFLPRVVSMVNGNVDKEILTDLWIKVARVHVIILGLLLSGLLIFGRQFLHLWIGRTLGEETVLSWWVAVLLISTITVPLVQCLGWQILQACNAIKFRVKILVFIAGVNLLLGYFLSLYYGAIGLAAGTAVSFIMGQWVFMNLLYRYKIGLNVIRFFRETLAGIGVPVLCFAIIFALVSIYLDAYTRTWLWWFCAVFIYAAVYTLIIINFYARETELSMLPGGVRKLIFFRKSIV